MKYKLYSKIQQEFEPYAVPYSKMLLSQEWYEKRLEINSREDGFCQVCKQKCMDEWLPVVSGNFINHVPATYEEIVIEKEYYEFGKLVLVYDDISFELKEQEIPKIPHVHHTYYLLGNLPWEYPNDDLMLVCHSCHQEIHDKEVIKVYKNNKKFELANFTPCEKCNGSGYLSEYSYYQDGICFRCLGACFEEMK